MLVILSIGELVVVPRGPIAGRNMRNVRRIKDAALVVDGRQISWFGRAADVLISPGADVLDAAGGCVLPSLIDCHTHAVFAGTRENEFVQRIEGKSYAQIANEGGGIRVSVEAVRRASLDDLVAMTQVRLRRMLLNGITTIEIKSGYGLNVEDEFKMLHAARPVVGIQAIDVAATYLAAHTIPREFDGRGDQYLDTVFADSVLARLRDERLAEFCDIFCESTAFNIEQSRRVLLKAKQFGLRPKIHADQITQMGASRLAAEVGAISADHLEKIDDGGIAALKSAATIAVLLPACSFFLGVEQAPARKIIEADVPVAIATDYNPGSSMVESLPLTMTIACTQMRMTPIEVVVAATANAAAAIGRQDRIGAIDIGMQADLVVLDVPSVERWMYEPGRNCVKTVLKRGKIVVDSAT